MNTIPEVREPLPAGVAFLDRSERVRLEVRGPDRAKFLHNLTTNEVKRLGVGRGVEAFVTSPQGKTLGFVTLLAAEDLVLVRTDPRGSEQVTQHFQKYGVFDDVDVRDVGPETFEFHLVGPASADRLRAADGEPPGDEDLRHETTRLAGRPVRVVRESPLGLPGLTVIGGRSDAEAVRASIGGPDVTVIDAATAEALRIEAGTPVSGRDVTPENLPQEVGRDARAISFVKGCYLGQETVARIDALGHVNKHLRGLLLIGGAGDVPPPGTPIEAAGKVVGAVTSAAFSARRGCPVALGYLKSAQAKVGTTVEVVAGGDRRAAVVSDLPMPGPS